MKSLDRPSAKTTKITKKTKELDQQKTQQEKEKPSAGLVFPAYHGLHVSQERKPYCSMYVMSTRLQLRQNLELETLQAN